jgi:protein involved in polysaccharide export with SLBB domain
MLLQMTYKISLSLGLLCVLACAHTPATKKAPTGGPAATQENDAAKPALQTAGMPTLGAGDIFEVRIFQEEDLSGTYRVGSDGSFNFPLIGNINIEGLTPNQSSDKIKENLKVYLVNPQVSIFIKEFNSKKVFVFGEVQRPGTFNYENRMNIIQAITLAGGFAKFADRNGTFVTRLIEGQEQRIQISVRSIGEGKRPNFSLEPGDIVYVPQSMF